MSNGPTSSLYKSDYAAKVREMVASGFTDAHIRHELKIDPKTMISWRRFHPDFRDALNRSKEQKLDLCEQALLKLSLGYNRTVEHVVRHPTTKQPTLVRTLEHVPGNVAATMIWLNNTRPDKWQRKPAAPPKPLSQEEDEGPDSIGTRYTKFVNENWSKFQEEMVQTLDQWEKSGLWK